MAKIMRGLSGLLAASLCGLLLAGCAPQDTVSTSVLQESPRESSSEALPASLTAITASSKEVEPYVLPNSAEGDVNTTSLTVENTLYFVGSIPHEYPLQGAYSLYRSDETGLRKETDNIVSIAGYQAGVLYLIAQNTEINQGRNEFGENKYQNDLIAHAPASDEKDIVLEDVECALFVENGTNLFYARIVDGKEIVLYLRQWDTGEEKELFRTKASLSTFSQLGVYEGRVSFFLYRPGEHMLLFSIQGELLADSLNAPLGMGYAIYGDNGPGWRDIRINCGSYYLTYKANPGENPNDVYLVQDAPGNIGQLQVWRSQFVSRDDGLFYFVPRIQQDGHEAAGIASVFDGERVLPLPFADAKEVKFVYLGYSAFAFVTESQQWDPNAEFDEEITYSCRTVVYELTGTMQNPTAVKQVCILKEEYRYKNEYYLDRMATSCGPYRVQELQKPGAYYAFDTRTGEISFTDTPGLQVEWYR